MRSRVSAVVAIVAAMTSAGCGLGAMRRVPLEATPATWERLSGEWKGDYALESVSRRGRIEFRLKGAEHEAFGDVLMIPEKAERPYGIDPSRAPDPRDRAGTESQLLSIRFVSAEGGQVRGSMDPYWDPDRKCTARAVFLGSVDGDAIAGTLTTVCDGGVRALEGRWRVTRTR